MGMSLRDAASAAASRARIGSSPGRVDSFFASAVEAGVDFATERLEDALESAERRLHAAENGVFARDTANERAEVAAIRERLDVIAKLGPPLAKRFELCERISLAKIDLAEREAEHAAALQAKLEQGRAALHVVGSASRKRAIDDRERDVRGKIERARNAELVSTYALRRWANENAEIADALAAEAEA
jgi:hypothetical protein